MTMEDRLAQAKHASQQPCRVIKLGGSLLDLDEVRPALRTWLALQPPLATVLIVGGGALADALRDWDRRFALGEETSHWLCVRAMGVSARLAVALWPEFTLAARWDELVAGRQVASSRIVFDVEDFLRRDEPHLPGAALACNWSVTSDSIAARVAAVLGADELVLLKSSLPRQERWCWSEAAECNFVDAYFPRVAPEVAAIRAVHLRDATFPQLRLAAP